MEIPMDTPPWLPFLVPLVALLCAIVVLAAMIVFGVTTARVARDKGRNPVGWFFIGFFLLLSGLALALVMVPAGHCQEHARGPQTPA
ncbi:MAG TPA: hypothetical protein VN478_05770 [Clostridia bacterium]|nr:hypothetical protein [Clostridia bacterium]